jgi:Cytochrome P460
MSSMHRLESSWPIARTDVFKGRHAGNKLWGDGWGWSWFDAANPSKTTSTDYKKDCQSCHVPARVSDWIYVNGYPPLKR